MAGDWEKDTLDRLGRKVRMMVILVMLVLLLRLLLILPPLQTNTAQVYCCGRRVKLVLKRTGRRRSCTR